MTIRYNETDNFFIESSKNWYLVLTIKDRKIYESVFNGSKKEKKELIEYLENLTNSKNYFKIYGVWNGEYNTDLFELNSNILIKRLKLFLTKK